jgi:hypothetical protein
MFGLVFMLVALVSPTPPPNIIFLLVDDLGHNDVGWKNSQIHTPTLDGLVAGGVELGHHYVFKYCSPTRASFLTGRLPYHVHQWNLDSNSPWGTNINMTFLSVRASNCGHQTDAKIVFSTVGTGCQLLACPSRCEVRSALATSRSPSPLARSFTWRSFM